MKKRILSVFLAVCLTLTGLALPASAFTDVQDPSTAVDVECLRLLGVLDGYADGSFRPDTVLNRAQFCKMAVYAQAAQKELGKYRSVTVFPDVKPSHWAASYINLASKGRGIILGFADGKFHPEAQVTAGQAVTILMRQLGYTDADVGAVWPDGYLAQAEIIGLTEGLNLTGSAPLTRGQAAKLFVNLLRCDKADGSSYADSIAASVVHTVLVSSSAEVNGLNAGMEDSKGIIYTMANKTSSGLLNGRMGTLLLDEQGKVMTFVPDAVGESRTVVLAQAKAGYLTDTSGQKFTISSDTPTWQGGEEKTWSQAFSWLNPGMSVTLYLENGGVSYVFAGSGAAASQAVVVYEDRSTAGLEALTGGNVSLPMRKNGVSADAGDLRAYDVVTYSGAAGGLQVCDVRVSGIYEACAPNPEAPETITVLGHEFPVLASAREGMAGLDVGDAVTLLLTADNQVAAALDSSAAKVRGNALGIVRSGGSTVTVDLLCGITVSGQVSESDSDLEGKLVRVSSGKRGFLALTELSGGVSGDLDTAEKTLGGKALAENVMVLRPVSGGLEAVSLAEIPTALVEKKDIDYAGTDWAGRVSVIVLGNKYGSGDYIYGRAIVRSADGTLAVEYGNGKQIGPMETTFDQVTNGSYVRAGLSADGSRYTSVLELKELRSVANSAWAGDSAVTVSGRTYTVPEDVACYNAATRRWLTLDQAHAFAERSNLYVDGSGVVRVVEVN